jgi:hypothetical protein
MQGKFLNFFQNPLGFYPLSPHIGNFEPTRAEHKNVLQLNIF